MIREDKEGKGDKNIYVFYVDVFLMQSCLMNACILWMVKELTTAEKHTGRRREILRIAAVSLVAGALQLVLLLKTGSYAVYFATSLLILIPGMITGMFGRSSPRIWCKRLGLGYVAAVGLGGTVGAAQNFLKIPQLPIWCAILCAFILQKEIRLLQKSLQKREQLYAVVLTHNGRSVECTALWDTGNHLHTETGNRPVHIVDTAVFKELKISARDFVGIASYCSLGNGDGILPLYEIDGLYTPGKNDNTEGTKAVVACAGKELLRHKPYQVILNVEGVVL